MSKWDLREYMRENGLTIERMSGADYNVVAGHHRYEYELRLNHAPTQDSMDFPYFTGIGITEDPEDRPEQILDMLVSDAWGVINHPRFEDWALEYGYDEDSRAAEKIWQAVRDQAEQLIRLIGRDELENLALNFERL